jgi:hypothetical protein
MIPERYKRDYVDAVDWHNGNYIRQLHKELGRAEAALQFAVEFLTLNSMTNELKQIEAIKQSK